MALIIPQLAHLDHWLTTWQTTPVEQRTLYRSLHTALKTAHRDAQAQQYLIKLLRTYNGAPASELKAVEADALSALAYALAARTDFNLFVLAKLDAIAQLNGKPVRRRSNTRVLYFVSFNLV